MANNCPEKGKNSGRAVNAIEDGPLAAITPELLNGFFIVDHEGYQTVDHRRKARATKPAGGVAGAMGVLPVETQPVETPFRRGPRHGGVVDMVGMANFKDFND